MKIALGMMFAVAQTAFAVVGPWDADVSDFPRKAGETGDSARILRAVEAAGKGGVVWFRRLRAAHGRSSQTADRVGRQLCST